MRSSRYSTLLRLLLAVVAVAGLTQWAANNHDRFEWGLHRERHAREPFDLNTDTRKITNVKPEAEHAGLPNGATLEALNGSPYTGQAQWAEVNHATSPGDSLNVGFRRSDGSSGTASFALLASQPHPGAPNGLGQTWRLFLLFGLSALLCMLIGYWVVFVKPSEPNAWLLLVLLLFPDAVFSGGLSLASGGWLVFRGLYWYLLQVVGPLALLPFAIYFPERSRIDVRAPWLKWIVLGPALVASLIDFRQLFGQYYLAGNPPWLIHAVLWADRGENALDLACVILYLVIIFDKLRSASTEDARRRLRVLLAGTGTGLGALLIAFVLLPDLGYSPNTSPESHGHPWLAYTGAAFFMMAPLTLAYVVLVQRAMDVSILLRTGTKYALARATLWAAQIILILIVTLRLLVPLLTQSQVTTAEVSQSLILLLIVFLLRSGVSSRVQAWLDKRFFRESYDAERVLSELSDEVRQFTETEPLLRTVSRRISETLHIDCIGMLLHNGQGFRLAEAVGVTPGSGNMLTLAGNSSTIRNLTNNSAPAQLYREDPDAWYLMADELERKTLDDLGTELLLPLPGRNRLMGVLSLGPKRSQAAWSKSDLHLLQVLATQTGMALEVSELAHSLAREAAGRERTNREMEIAREVQERLFPQEMPMIDGASIAGACRPAQGVGGDYYDVFPLQDGRIGLAIGDVSGKGISAALLMASLRASLRGVTLDNPRDFAKLMDKVNRLVYEASADNRYATFFFGALDPVSRVLECVNAGHNAPLILRQKAEGGAEILRVEADGPVVGLLPFAPYTEQRLRLEPGDLLITYTDGISEAMTHDDEEWGEDRMMTAAAAAGGGTAEQVLRAIFAAADKFTAGAPQHDDMTLLVLKLQPPTIKKPS